MRQRLLLATAVAGAVLVPAVPAVASPPAVTHYRLIDLGTFGGPNADVIGPSDQITASGAVLAFADTTAVDPDAPYDGAGSGDGFIHHPLIYQDGRRTELGALPGRNNSAVFEMNRHGLGVGGSETGAIDPRVGLPAVHPVLFRSGRVLDIGTLPGGSEGFAVAVNDAGVVAGVSNDRHTGGPTFPDFFDWHGQIRSFVWQDGRMTDLGTLGGPGAVVDTLNERGQVNGDSYVSARVDPASGHPTVHPFLWEDGRMRDLGGLGGSTVSSRWMNERGQIVGQASLPGETAFHSYLWDGRRLRDIGVLPGGDFASAEKINDHGVVTGYSNTAAHTGIHTYVWQDGRTTDLSPTTTCTFPEWINEAGDVVGGRCGADGPLALLWHAGRQYDLDALADARDVELTSATYLDERGRIVALGTLPNGDQHVFLLTPCGQH